MWCIEFCLSPPRLSLAECEGGEHFREWVRGWVGGRHYTCTTRMNSVLIVEHFVAQFFTSIFIGRGLSAVPHKHLNAYICTHSITQRLEHKWLTHISIGLRDMFCCVSKDTKAASFANLWLSSYFNRLIELFQLIFIRFIHYLLNKKNMNKTISWQAEILHLYTTKLQQQINILQEM